MNGHESAFVDAFVAPAHRERAIHLLGSRFRDRKSKAKFHRWISNGIDLDRRYATELPSDATPESVAALLRDAGAPESCWIVATTGADAAEVPLEESLAEFFSGVGGVIISCAPGRIALYGAEHPPGHRFILIRRT